MGLVYVVTNRTSGKSYVGVTSGLVDDRWNQHVYSALKLDSQYAIHRALRKHGVDAFRVDVVETCDDYGELIEAEKDWISWLGTYENGYNMTRGGEGTLGNRGNLGKKKSVETRAKMSVAARSRSEETKRKLSESLRGKRHSVETKEKISKTLTGKNLTDEHRKNIRDALNDSSLIEKNRTAHLRENLSEDTLRKISEASSRSIEQIDPETGEVLRVFNRIRDASEFVGVKSNSITHVLKGRSKTCRGYFWKYVDQSHVDVEFHLREETKKRSSDSRRRRTLVEMIDQDGRVVETYETMNSASRNCGIHISKITECLNDPTVVVDGFRFRIVEKNDNSVSNVCD